MAGSRKEDRANEPMRRAQAVAEALGEEIRTGILAPGHRLPPEREIAERFSVSRLVVREAIDLLQRERLVYTKPRCRPVVVEPEAQRRQKRVGGGKIGVWLWPYSNDYAASMIFRGVQFATQHSEYRLLTGSVAHGSWDAVVLSEAAFLAGLADDPDCVGAIVWYLGGERNVPHLLRLRERGLPIVFLDRKPPRALDGDHVGTDNLGAAARLVSQLIHMGHRRIACLTNIDWVSTVQERVRGYERALESAGVAPDDALLAKWEVREGEGETEAMIRTLRGLLDQATPPTALFAINDTLALAAIDALREMGLSVPEDLSVAGFDGLLRWVPGGGQLTSAAQDFSRIGELAAELLLERLDAGALSTYRHVLLDAPASLRGSTRPVPTDLDEGGAPPPPAEIQR
jgi:LacI family transcriptional regulator